MRVSFFQELFGVVEVLVTGMYLVLDAPPRNGNYSSILSTVMMVISLHPG